jgi:FTR1 family protein
MLEALVITLREGVEAALIVGIIAIYLRKIDRLDLMHWVFSGLAIALGASVLGGFVLQYLEINEEAFEGVVLLLSAFFVGTMVIWMAKTSKGLRREIETKVDELTGGAETEDKKSTGFLGMREGWGLLLFTFIMIFREGVETVLFLSAISLDTEGFYTLIGALSGLAFAVVFGILFVKGSLRIDLRRFFTITTVVLLILVFQLIVNGFHELFEAGVLPSTQREMAIVGPLVRNNLLFFMLILALPFYLILFNQRRRGTEKEQSSEPLKSADKRKMKALLRKERVWRQAASIAFLGILFLFGYNFVYSRVPTELSPTEFLDARDGEIRISIAVLEDGNLHRFGYHAKETQIRFILMKIGEGQYGCALDACEICGDKGYYQEGVNVVCRHCIADIYIPTIGRSGGCNPIPLNWELDGDNIVIDESDLEEAQRFFSK